MITIDIHLRGCARLYFDLNGLGKSFFFNE